jgi:O-antigen/teichoic acid export membrane protein
MPLSHSLKKRFIYKLGGNIAALALGIIAMAVISRVLGPADFGRFDFLTANFKLVLDTLALQFPIAYFNWISRKGHKESTDYANGLTFYWTISTASLLAIFIYAAIESGLSVWLWPDVDASYLWYALAFTFAVSFYQLFIYLADGRALTVGLEKIRLVQNVLKTAGILLLFGWGVLTLDAYFMLQIAVVCFSIIASVVWLTSRKALSVRLLTFWSAKEGEKAKFNEFAVSYPASHNHHAGEFRLSLFRSLVPASDRGIFAAGLLRTFRTPGNYYIYFYQRHDPIDHARVRICL